MRPQLAIRSIPIAAGNPVLPVPPTTMNREEHNRIKRKLEDDVKRSNKKAKMFKSLFKNSLGIPSKFKSSEFIKSLAARTKICLDVPDFAAELERMQTFDRGNRYTVRSQSLELIAGCQWTMDTLADYSNFGIYFRVNNPLHYQQYFYSFHVNL